MPRKKEVVATLPLHNFGRKLADLPLAEEDWRQVWLATQGWLAQINLIAARVQAREKGQSTMTYQEANQIVDQVAQMTPEQLETLHGWLEAERNDRNNAALVEHWRASAVGALQDPVPMVQEA